MPAAISFRFDERKTTAAACYLLHRAGGSMEYMRLLKLLYLAERRCLELYGRPLCGDVVVAMKHGPVLSTVYDRIKGSGPANSPWRAAIKRDHYTVTLAADLDLGPLSRAELAVLDEVHDAHAHQDTWTLVDRLHESLPEWMHPGDTSKPIPPEAVLEALGKAPGEVEAIAASAREAAYFDELFGASR